MTPFDLKSEEIVLGSIMLDQNKAFEQTEGVITEDDFYKPSHQKIFLALKQLCAKSAPTDPFTLAQKLKEMDCLIEIGGHARIAEIFAECPTSFYIGYHAKKVAEYSIRRKLSDACRDINTQACDTSIPTEEILDEAEKKVLSISTGQPGDSIVHIKDAVIASVNYLSEAHGKEGVTGVPSGFTKLDDLLLGFQKQDLIIVACRPSVGKTSFALGVARHAALEAKKYVLFFSLEMSVTQITSRLLAAEGKIDSHLMRSNRMKDNDWAKLTRAAGKLAESNLFFEDTSSLKVLEIKAKARRMKSKYGRLDLIVIDYLQIMGTPARVENRERAISEISRSLKALAKEMDCPVMALSQLNRSVETRAEKTPMMSDIRESGAIEQDADVIIFIHRDTREGALNEDSTAQFIIGKHRNGPRDTVQVAWLGRYTCFENLSGASHAPTATPTSISSWHKDND